MLSASRKVAFVLLTAFALAAVGCGSNNKGKIEGKWKVMGLPEKTDAKAKEGFAAMEQVKAYMYFDFKTDGGLTFGVGAEKPEVLEFLKANAPDNKVTWDMKYKLLSGDNVEIYDIPKDMQKSGLFGSKEKAKVSVKITGDEMKMTDEDGTAPLTRMK